MGHRRPTPEALARLGIIDAGAQDIDRTATSEAITGACLGIGRATVRLLARHSAKVM